MNSPHMLLIGGRSGVGKSTVAFALHDLLSASGVQHAVVEGDALDLAYPAPWEQHMAERNLRAIWNNYAADGYRRLIYTNTVSVLEADKLARALGDDAEVTSVLLQASDKTAEQRLGRREQGDSLSEHVARSVQADRFLDARAPSSVHRITTDTLDPGDIAEEIIQILRW